MPVKIHGKEYSTVAERINILQEKHPNYSLTTEITNVDENFCIIKATLRFDERIFTGHAREERQSSHINKTSYIENCETSAIGRALAAAGYAGEEFASADEVANAVKNQENNPFNNQSQDNNYPDKTLEQWLEYDGLKKYKGTKLKDIIDEDYLNWIIEKSNLSSGLKEAAKEVVLNMQANDDLNKFIPYSDTNDSFI